MRSLLLALASLIIGLALAVPATSAAATGFRQVSLIEIEGKTLRVGWVVEPGLGIRTVRVVDNQSRNVFPLRRIDREGRDRGCFPYSAYGGGHRFDGRGTLVVWRPTLIPPLPASPVGADWFGWNRASRRFEWVRTDYSDAAVSDFRWQTVAPLFSGETDFQASLRLAERVCQLIRQRNWAKLAALHAPPENPRLAQPVTPTRLASLGRLDPNLIGPVDWRGADWRSWGGGRLTVSAGAIGIEVAAGKLRGVFRRR